jgi:hypothetical protein
MRKGNNSLFLRKYLAITPPKKQEHVITSEAMQFQEVRLLRLLSGSSQLHYVFLSLITRYVASG